MTSEPQPFRLLQSRLGKVLAGFLVLVFVGAVALDQASKAHVQTTMLVSQDDHDPRVYRGSYYPVGAIGTKNPGPDEVPFYVGLRLQYSRNLGAAFSLLADLDDSIRVPFFYGVTIFAIIMIFYLMRSLTYDQHLTRLGLAFIASGAIGNFLDRLVYGYVVDFIDVDWNLFGWRHDFAIFNVADICINIGIYLYIIDFIVTSRRASKEAKTLQAEASTES